MRKPTSSGSWPAQCCLWDRNALLFLVILLFWLVWSKNVCSCNCHTIVSIICFLPLLFHLPPTVQGLWWQGSELWIWVACPPGRNGESRFFCMNREGFSLSLLPHCPGMWTGGQEWWDNWWHNRTNRQQNTSMWTRCERCFYMGIARNPLNEIDYMLPGWWLAVLLK